MTNRSQVYAVAWGGIQDPGSGIPAGEPTLRLTSTRVASPVEACRQAFGMVSPDMTAMPMGGNMTLLRTNKFRVPRLDELKRRHVALQSKHQFAPMTQECVCVEFDGPIISGFQKKREPIAAG